MNYVRCVNNKAYLRVPDEAVNGALGDLTLGAVYKVLPTSPQERDSGLLRIIDNSGEDYLYPASYFQPLDWHTLPAEGEPGHAALTIHLDPRTKAILRAEALAAHTSMGALGGNGSRSDLKSKPSRRQRQGKVSPAASPTNGAGSKEMRSPVAHCHSSAPAIERGSPRVFGVILPTGSDKTSLVLYRRRMEGSVHREELVNRRHVFFCLPLLLLSACVGQHGASPVYVGGGGRAWAKVPTVVLVAPETDPRLQVTREAVDFWNRTFAELGSPFRLGPIVHTTDPVSLADLHRLSVQVVGIRSHRLYPLTLPNVTRNVIAYELGHAIGLGHNDNPTTLMCGRPAPCRPAAFQSRTERFFPLTKAEKARLIAMYPPNWQSR